MIDDEDIFMDASNVFKNERGGMNANYGLVIERYTDLNDGAMKISRFSGTQDVSEFFKKFELVCNSRDMDDDIKIKRLPLYFTGPAMLYYESLDAEVKSTYEGIKHAFIVQFGNLESKAVKLAKLHSMRQGETESVIAYTNRFEEVARRAYVGVPAETSNELILLQYQNSLLPHIKKYLLLRQPENLETQKD